MQARMTHDISIEQRTNSLANVAVRDDRALSSEDLPEESRNLDIMDDLVRDENAAWWDVSAASLTEVSILLALALEAEDLEINNNKQYELFFTCLPVSLMSSFQRRSHWEMKLQLYYSSRCHSEKAFLDPGAWDCGKWAPSRWQNSLYLIGCSLPGLTSRSTFRKPSKISKLFPSNSFIIAHFIARENYKMKSNFWINLIGKKEKVSLLY
jgi:hypothetical protein